MRAVIFREFEGVNKVALDRGLRQIFGIGSKQAKDLTDELIESKELTFTNVSGEHVVQLLTLGYKANVSVEAQKPVSHNKKILIAHASHLLRRQNACVFSAKNLVVR